MKQVSTVLCLFFKLFFKCFWNFMFSNFFVCVLREIRRILISLKKQVKAKKFFSWKLKQFNVNIIIIWTLLEGHFEKHISKICHTKYLFYNHLLVLVFFCMNLSNFLPVILGFLRNLVLPFLNDCIFKIFITNCCH